MSEENIIVYDKLAEQYDQWFDEHHGVRSISNGKATSILLPA